LICRQTGNLIGKTDVRKRRRSWMENSLSRNFWRRTGQFLDQPLEGLNASLEISNL